MADKVKVKVKPGKSIALENKFLSGDAEVPADKVAGLVRRGLIEAPAGEVSAPAPKPPASAPDVASESPAADAAPDAADDASAADTKGPPKRGRK
jgi:hypothetical protein